MGQKAIAVGLEPGTQFSVVVDFAVADEPDRAIRRGERLSTTQQIDYGQAAEAERSVVIVFDGFVIGPAMRERVEHAPYPSDLVEARRGLPTRGDDSCNSTHDSARPPAPSH